MDKPKIQSALPPDWRTLRFSSARGLAHMEPVEDEHGEVPTGVIQVSESSAAFDPSLWVDATSYGNEIGTRMARSPQKAITLHFRAWQARRVAYQLLDMAEHVDPGGGTEPPSEEEE